MATHLRLLRGTGQQKGAYHYPDSNRIGHKNALVEHPYDEEDSQLSAIVSI